MESSTSGAVMDHHEAQAERDAAEAERLAEEQAALDSEPSQTPEPTAGPEDPEPEEPQGPSIKIEGAQLSLDVGGKKPTGASLRLTGGKVDIPTGQLRKGQKIAVLVEASVDAIEFVDIKDAKTGTIVGCDRRHKARITSVALYDE
jgi:hypothetical protein